MTTLELYTKANFDILQNSLDRVKEQEYASENMINQLETLSKQAKSFADWIKSRKKFG